MRLPLLIAAAFALHSSAAFAIDWSKPILDENGKTLPNCPKMTGAAACDEILTLGAVASFALFANYPDEQATMTGEDKFKRGMLALRIASCGECDLNVDDMALVKKLIGKAYGPLVIVRAWSMIDPASMAAAK